MRPKHLRYPFTDGVAPSVFVRDRVWYVPKENPLSPFDYTFPGWQDVDFFGNDGPVQVEYCSGNGAWIAERAARSPCINWVAVEKKFDRVRKIWSKIHNHGLTNLIVVYGEALQVTSNYFASQSLDGIYVNFPDPWPKRHHARYRLLTPTFLDELARCLRNSTPVTIATDDIEYSEAIIDLFNQHRDFSSPLPAPYYLEEMPDYGSSYFERLWRSKGSGIRYSTFTRAAV